jgi:hypothetical protein
LKTVESKRKECCDPAQRVAPIGPAPNSLEPKSWHSASLQRFDRKLAGGKK